MTRAEYRSNLVPKPSNLFSHSDQQQQGMSSILQASTLTGINGWGGRVGDKVAGMNPPTATPMSMSFSGTQTFGTGVQVRTLALPTGGTFGFTGDNLAALPGSVAYERAAARAELLAAGDASAMVGASQVNAIVAQNASAKISPILTGTGSAAITGPFAGMNSSLANQLRAVAKVIEARATLQHNRQIFFVSIGGFDTHSGQGTTNVGAGLPSLYQQIGQALGAFYRSTELMGVVNNVTTFTLSDFNRTFKPNGQGTDHAWGGHHFVMGGSVVGGRFYGQYPDLILGGNNDTDTAGRWIPTTAFDQYGATLGRWFGVPDVDLAAGVSQPQQVPGPEPRASSAESARRFGGSHGDPRRVRGFFFRGRRERSDAAAAPCPGAGPSAASGCPRRRSTCPTRAGCSRACGSWSGRSRAAGCSRRSWCRDRRNRIRAPRASRAVPAAAFRSASRRASTSSGTRPAP